METVTDQCRKTDQLRANQVISFAEIRTDLGPNEAGVWIRASIVPLMAALRANYRPVYGDTLPPALHVEVWLPN